MMLRLTLFFYFFVFSFTFSLAQSDNPRTNKEGARIVNVNIPSVDYYFGMDMWGSYPQLQNFRNRKFEKKLNYIVGSTIKKELKETYESYLEGWKKNKERPEFIDHISYDYSIENFSSNLLVISFKGKLSSGPGNGAFLIFSKKFWFDLEKCKRIKSLSEILKFDLLSYDLLSQKIYAFLKPDYGDSVAAIYPDDSEKIE